MKNTLITKTIEQFRQEFLEEPDIIVLAPGRINIIGEHIDYNNGFVLPAAIDRYICFAVSPSKKNDESRFIAIDLEESHLHHGEPQPLEGHSWANYLLGVIHQIQERGKKVPAINLAFSSNIPMGSGLSSSAALECGFAYALNSLFNFGFSKEELALIGQKAEHTYAGVNCGIMDQFASVFGEENKVFKLDCDTLDYEYFDADLGENTLVLLDSGVKHTHLTSGYNTSRKKVEEGLSIIKTNYPFVKTWRHVTHQMIDDIREKLGNDAYQKSNFVVNEIERVSLAADALQNKDFESLGTLITKTHDGLSKQYGVSCDELDFLVEKALQQEGVLGARMMGGGFGGCSINLVKKQKMQKFIDTLTELYQKEYNIDLQVYPIKIAEGVHEYKKETKKFDVKNQPHRRYNPLLDEWILVSPQRATRPWQGQQEKPTSLINPKYDSDCYLCPGNVRVNGDTNPDYKGTYVFNNDFGALLQEKGQLDEEHSQDELFMAKAERGINRVICFSDDHSLTLPLMKIDTIKHVVDVWQNEYNTLGQLPYINYVQIFENKGQIMGCSNPHPHGQIWAQEHIPSLVARTQENMQNYYQKNGISLLQDYLEKEIENGERIVLENKDFVALVPFWATWPYETMIVSKRHISNIGDCTEEEKWSLAQIIKDMTTKYDNLFEISFPYSAGIHQSPTDGKQHPEWDFHMHFYPPLLRSASVKKFMVGYELLAEAQRDITPEQSAETLRKLPVLHYSANNNGNNIH